MSLSVHSVRLVLTMAMLGTVSACAMLYAQPEQMVPQSGLIASQSLDSPLRGAIAIAQVRGGEDANP